MRRVSKGGEDRTRRVRHKLLVLNDGQSGYGPLPRTYDELTVWEPSNGRPAPEPPAGPFAAILVDRSPFDLGWLDRMLGAVTPALAPDGRVLIRLDPDGDAAAPPDAVDFGGLAWDGLEVVSGRVCAVLRPGEPQAPVAELLSASHAAVRLTRATLPPAAGAEADPADRVHEGQAELPVARSDSGQPDSRRPSPARRRSPLRALARRLPLARPVRALLRQVRTGG